MQEAGKTQKKKINQVSSLHLNLNEISDLDPITVF